jgi:transcription-repair coupling factor (superfamily II helicase)
VINTRQIHYVKGAEGIIAHNYPKQNLLFVVANEYIDDAIDILKFFVPDREIYSFPAYDVLPFERISPSKPVTNTRISTLTALSNSTLPSITVTSLEALMRKTLPKRMLVKNYLNIKLRDVISMDELIQKLVTLGFSRLSNACNASEFSVRGSIIDIVFEDGKDGYRIDFFGSKIESIRTFDPQTQKSLSRLDSILIHPCDEVIVNDEVLKDFTNTLRTNFGLTANTLIETFSNHRKMPGQENLLPLFYGNLDSLFDYLAPNITVFFPYDLLSILPQIEEKIKALYDDYLKLKKRNDDSFFPITELSSQYLNTDQILNKIKNLEHVTLNPFDDNRVYGRLENFSIESKSKSKSAFEIFKRDVLKNQDKKTIIACFSKGSQQRLKSILTEYDINVTELASSKDLYSLQSKVVGLACIPLEEGLSYKNFRIFSEQDLLGERLVRKPKKKQFSNNILSELASFQEGELVVHLEHGIGRFEGLKTLTVSGVIHDFVKLIYAGGDAFYLPVENLELISRFGSESDIELDKLGASNWQMRKAKLKNKIKIAAERLLKIAAERSIMKSDSMTPLEGLYEEFCNKFPYVETDDQLRAINDVFNDLSNEKPMDRLICGDVGFGKTEVALRAAFIAVASNNPHQVAVLVPTTLLARQHFATFTNRFDGFPIRIRQLSKFTSKTEIKNIKEGLTSGQVDIIIGTHALLAKDISFKRLGLIIIDEEQHFGVGQKERLKEIKAHAHVLTLSATPIPRTLQLSLAGIKDLSIIATPPIDRLPIKSFVIPYDQLSIREAILREYYRGGKIFYVTPRSSYLDSIIEMIKEVIPEVKAQKAHGKMPAGGLDKIMNDFYDDKFNVLVSTTIVESGLDIQNANTIIVDRAHMFGLSQLYQIRGRVGRSNTQAFSYLTYPESLRLSDIAEKRLQILQSFENLGAGFSIASYDMDLRGYGNLVGEEQSGYVKEVGIELYQHMLEEAIKAIKEEVEVEDSEEWSPNLNLKISVQIPESYIPDASLRLNLYRRIAAISNPQELEDFAAELIDRFGNLPLEAEHLITIVRLKQLAKAGNIEKLDIGEKGILITFRHNQPKSPDIIMEFINKNTGLIKMHKQNKLLILGDFKDEMHIIETVETILRQLC